MMRGLANSVTAALIVFIGIWPRISGMLVDDALDVNGTPEQRAENARTLRTAWADVEFEASLSTVHVNNGERTSAAAFHKTLPHDELGQVDPTAFGALIECVATADFDICELVAAGGNANLANPLGGIATDMAGPSSSAITIPSVPGISSPELASQLAEVYWMALARDVPFSQYGVDDITVTAAANLAAMPGFASMNGVAIGEDGTVDPMQQLFRNSAVGVETGPFISQLLLQDFIIDSITVTPKQTTAAPGIDYMTAFDQWLFIQNGGIDPEPDFLDPTTRFLRNARDVARMVNVDTIYTEAFRGALILLEADVISRPGFNGPYTSDTRQEGFVSYGTSHLMRLIGTGEIAQRSSWYQKWNVHLFPRPEALAGTLHNVLFGNITNVEFDPSILDNDELLDRVAAHNEAQNGQGPAGITFLMPQASKNGSPTHPSYPSGHAVQNGAFATVLKALVGLERGAMCVERPVFPDDDGQELLFFTGDECLTYEGEINKLAVNVAFGRQMLGIHYRFDGQEGMILGETIAVRLLHQELIALPEGEPYEFRLMFGQTIRLEPDGSFFIDDVECVGAAYTGVDDCAPL